MALFNLYVASSTMFKMFYEKVRVPIARHMIDQHTLSLSLVKGIIHV